MGFWPETLARWSAEGLPAEWIAEDDVFQWALIRRLGFDKRILARGVDEIEAAVHRLVPLVEGGGYLPFCDHYVPLDVGLKNFIQYILLAKKIWCRGTEFEPLPGLG